MIRTNYPKPSNLLQQQKQKGKSYWDMIGYPLPEVTVTANYPHEQRVWNTVNQARYGFNEPEFLRRLDYNDRRYIKTPYGGESTYLMANDGNYAYPMIQDINGTLHNYDEKYGDYWNRDPKENGDYIKFQTPGDARYFSEHYKKNWPIFFQGAFKDGKDMIYNHLPGYVVGKGVEQTEPSYKKINIQFPLWYFPFDNENIDDSLYDPTKNVLQNVTVTPNSDTIGLINEMRKTFPNKVPRDVIYNVANKYSSSIGDSYNDVLRRTLQMYKFAGSPTIINVNNKDKKRLRIFNKIGFKPRSAYWPQINTIFLYNNRQFVPELAHAIQHNTYGDPSTKDSLQTYLDVLKGGVGSYNNIGYSEYNAHKLIEPNIKRYIMFGDPKSIQRIHNGAYGKEAK